MNGTYCEFYILYICEAQTHASLHTNMCRDDALVLCMQPRLHRLNLRNWDALEKYFPYMLSSSDETILKQILQATQTIKFHPAVMKHKLVSSWG